MSAESTQTDSMNSDSTNATRGTLLVVDGHSLAFRAFFALPVENFSTESGQATNAVWGFATMLSQVINAEKPDLLAVAFDVKGGTFRNQLLPQYKGTRDAAPEELLTQLPLIQEMLTALGVTYIEKPGFEGDDVIGTLATMGDTAGYHTLVLSGDRDAFQLIDENVTVLYPGHHFKDLKHMTPAAVEEKYHVTPAQYPDLAALRGETADNIPGVPGVGDGFAAKWINLYGGLDGIVAHADEIKGKKGEALRDSIDQVLLNRKVNALVRDLDLGIDISQLTFGMNNTSKLDALFKRLEFGSRTRARLLASFNGASNGSGSGSARAAAAAGVAGTAAVGAAAVGAAAAGAAFAGDAAAAGDAIGEDGQQLPLAEPTVIADAAAFRRWAADHGVSEGGVSDGDASADGADGGSAAVQAVGNGAKTDGETSTDPVILVAHGSAKPGAARLDRLAIEHGGHAALISARALAQSVDAEQSTQSDQSVQSADSTDSAKPRESVESAEPSTFASVLQHWLDAHHNRIVVHGYKEHLHMLASVGITLATPHFDTKLGGYLVHPDFHADSLADAVAHFLDIHTEQDAEEPQGELDLGDFDAQSDAAGDQGDAAARATDANESDWDAAQIASMLADAAAIRVLDAHLAALIDERRQRALLDDIELPVSRVLYRMESTGATVDMARLETMRDHFAADARDAQEEAWRYAGRELNLQSPKQLQKVLFEDFGLKPVKKTKSGSYTTNAAALLELSARSIGDEQANGFLVALLRHRETIKLKQIVATLIDAVNAHDGRIHTTFEQTVAATGRLSSVDPNLQNIPNRNAAGREIRSAFVPGEGFVSLLSCDYSQVELRIMASQSGDEALIEAFRSGTDFHRYVASLVYGVPADEITTDQRSHVKAMSYGLAYGLSTYGLAQQLRISPSQADGLKAKYFATFGKVHDYLESLVAQARRNGYTETMFGRRRYFPALRSTNRVARDAAERAALNAPIQGSAADIMKIAMIRADAALRGAGVKSRIILQIHDELVVEVAAGEADQVRALVADAMEHAVELAVPLDVSTGIGDDWQLAAH